MTTLKMPYVFVEQNSETCFLTEYETGDSEMLSDGTGEYNEEMLGWESAETTRDGGSGEDA